MALPSKIDPYRNLRFNDLDPREFEGFFLHFLNAGVKLTVAHHGQELTRKIISASTYASGSGRKQFGIDLRAEVEGGEVWAFQCKRVQKWTASETKEAIKKGREYKAHHYFLLVACDVSADVHEEVYQHGDWTLWNLDKICAEFRLRVSMTEQLRCLQLFLNRHELKQFIPFSTEALISPECFFEHRLDLTNPFRHNWALVGRDAPLAAMRAFMGDAQHKVLLLTATGGEGKSRLLLEFCRELPRHFPDAEALFLNPHQQHDNPEFALMSEAERQVIFVDDAHRVEQVPVTLLNHIRQNTKAKVVLATRPQAVEALSMRLFDAGLPQESITKLTLPALKSADVRTLAKQALGDASDDQAKALAQQTGDSPFLTVIAGDLIRRGKLQFPGDVSAAAFRQNVFRAFEAENLRSVPVADHSLWSALLRLVALLAPIEDPVEFAEKAIRCLGCGALDIETQLGRLQAAQLVVGQPNKLRVVPDLFADFLVYDACFEPGSAKPLLITRTIQEFADRSPAMLRNLAEAAWIAHRNGIADKQFLGILMTAEFQRFESASFFQRARIVEHWTSFGAYLPFESLELVRLAVALKTATPESAYRSSPWALAELDTHSYVLQHLPSLLRPIVSYHDEHRRAALELLWELGLALDWKQQANNQNHPWAAIAGAMSFEPDKPASVTLGALDWLVEKVRQPEVLKSFEDPTPVLNSLLAPCFSHFAESRWFEGRTLHVRTGAVSLANTQPIRDRALSIISYVLEHGSWLAALDAISALNAGYHRIARHYEDKVGDLAQFRLEWRSERLKSLRLIRVALQKHGHVAVRYAVRCSLKELIAYEEDSVFQSEARDILKSVHDDLELRVTLALLSHGLTEDEEEPAQPSGKDDYAQQQIQWETKVARIAQELSRTHSEPKRLFVYLEQLVTDLVSAGESPHFHLLYTGLAATDSPLAAGLAKEILVTTLPTHLVDGWPLLIAENLGVNAKGRSALYETAANGGNARAKRSLVDHFSWRLRSGSDPLSESEIVLVEKLAADADVGIAMRFLWLVTFTDRAVRDWAWGFLFHLPLHEIARQAPDELIDVLSPHRNRDIMPPEHVARHILAQLSDAPRLDFQRRRETWSYLKRQYAKEIYELVVNRITREAREGDCGNYDPIPDDWPASFDLPELQAHPTYADICRDLWQRVTSPTEPKHYFWRQLFQAVVIQDGNNWLSDLNELVQICTSVEKLKALVELVHFNGSLVIFRQPDFVRNVLRRAESLGGAAEKEAFRFKLCNSAGPQGRSFTNGKLNEKDDYVEAAAAKAAEAHAEDPVLGPFYRWIVEWEQRDRLLHQARFEAESENLE